MGSRPGRPVWAHSQGHNEGLWKMFVDFCSGRDVKEVPACDSALARADLATNEASCLALIKAGVLDSREASRLAAALLDLGEKIRSGHFHLDPNLEDIHINIESFLTKTAGDLAGKIHSGRSRNDQVACDIRLWQRTLILNHLTRLCDLGDILLKCSLRERKTLMPGFSHHQRAFVTTFGHLMASHCQALLRDIERGVEVLHRVDCCPLGAAAGFGTSWPIDRDYLMKLLGFRDVVTNSLDAVSSRLEVECETAAWLALWMTHASCLAQDLILFTMEEFRWIRLAPETTTGSSIMPQKRNPDFAEVIKGKASLVHGALASLLSLGKGQPSGYHRDSQYSKPLGQDIWREVSAIPTLFKAVLQTMTLDRIRMKQAVQGGFLEAAEWADTIAQESGLPFREVYGAISLAVDDCRELGCLTLEAVNKALRSRKLAFEVSDKTAGQLSSPDLLLARRCSSGSPNPEEVAASVERYRGELASLRGHLKTSQQRWLKSDQHRLAALRRFAEKG